MTSLIVGTAGHIDHGKSALVRALTGTDPDRLPEEKRRGITIDLGFADLQLDDLRIGFVDVPGHERFVKNMLAGAHGIDVLALIIAADEGVMPQTREHFDICRLLGVRNGLIVITKSDLVEKEMLSLVETEAHELVAGSFLENAPIVAVSSKTGAGLESLRDVLNGRRSVLTGPSGVGKSSLLNALFPGANLRVGAISESVNKGRHTTVGALMLPLPGTDGGYVIDTPGLREVGLWALVPEQLDQCFPEIRGLSDQCRFADCRHISEPDCAVREAVRHVASA